MTALTPTCVWRATPELVVALDRRFGEPTDSYVNGSQTWLRPDGPDGAVLEWRLHPVAGYAGAGDIGVHEVFASVAFALANGDEPPLPVASLWDGLEVFPAHGSEIEPAPLSAIATECIGIAPTTCGLVDHERVADEWERSHGKVSIVDALIAQLDGPSG